MFNDFLLYTLFSATNKKLWLKYEHVHIGLVRCLYVVKDNICTLARSLWKSIYTFGANRLYQIDNVNALPAHSQPEQIMISVVTNITSVNCSFLKLTSLADTYPPRTVQRNNKFTVFEFSKNIFIV